MTFKKIVIGLLISAILPLFLQKMMSFEQWHVSDYGAATVNAQFYTFSPLGYIVASICLFIVYLALVYIWTVRKKRKDNFRK